MDNTPKKKTILIVLGVIAGIVLIAGGAFFIGRMTTTSKSETQNTTITPSRTAEITLTPTPSVEVNVTKTPTKKPLPTNTPAPTVTSTPAVTSTPTPTNAPTTVTGVNVNVSPTTYTGSCASARLFTFSAVITANGATTVKYKWVRSDGASGAEQTISFASASSQTVTDTWTLGGPGFSYAGWEKVQVSQPNTIESNQATFSLNCS